MLQCVCGMLQAGLDWSRLPTEIFLHVKKLVKAPPIPLDVGSLTHAVHLLLMAIGSDESVRKNQELVKIVYRIQGFQGLF